MGLTLGRILFCYLYIYFKIMQNRRNFIKRGTILLVGGTFFPSLFSACKVERKHIGLQLYSLKDVVQEKGIQKVLEIVAEIGYTHIETYGYSDGKIYGTSPEEFKTMCDNAGLRVTGAHIGHDYNKENEKEIMGWWDKAIEAHAKIGVKYMIQPSMPVNTQTTLDNLKLYCDYFNTVGFKTAASDISFGYHNHSFEFAKIDDKIIFDFLIENTSKNHLFFELDVYWVVVGEKNPVEYLRNYPDRIRVLHIKDEKELGASGKMDFRPIFEQAYRNGIKDWYVEVEQYTNNDPVASVKQSYDFLNKQSYVV